MTRKDRSRQQILNAAIIEFEQYGVEAVSMDALAKAAGLTRATIYNLFESKQQIAALIVQQKVAEWSLDVRERMQTENDGLALLIKILFQNAEICQQYPNIALNVLTKPQKTALPEGDKNLSFRYLVQDLLALCQQQGIVRNDQSASYLMFMLLGIYTQMMIFAITTKMDVSKAQIEQMVRVLIEGIGGRGED